MFSSENSLCAYFFLYMFLLSVHLNVNYFRQNENRPKFTYVAWIGCFFVYFLFYFILFCLIGVLKIEALGSFP